MGRSVCVHVWERILILLENRGGQGELSVIRGSKPGLIVRNLDHLDPVGGIRSSKLQKGLCKIVKFVKYLFEIVIIYELCDGPK